MRRRAWLASMLMAPVVRAEVPAPEATLQFPRDHGAHPSTGIEWWYVTGWLGTFEHPRWGVQITFFRRRTGLAEGIDSRFAPRQLLFAHAALTDLAGRRHLHAQRVARWSGAADAGAARAGLANTDVHIGNWQLQANADTDTDGYRMGMRDEQFSFDLVMRRTQPGLLQGEAGLSQKGPDRSQTSRYVTEPQLVLSGRLSVDGRPFTSSGQAWLDHEWSDQLMHPLAVGWDWVGFNLADGSALTVFRLRRADGTSLWAGGSWRAAGAAPQSFDPRAVLFTPGRRWTSGASGAQYPVEWSIQTPAGHFRVAALMDAQELDSRASTGTHYWEGLSELRDAHDKRVGLGYLEMTGYAGRLNL